MHPTLRLFIRQYLTIMMAALFPVFFTAFVSIPFNLGGHPGEPRIITLATDQHMS